MPTHHAPFLILQTGQPIASQRRHGPFAHWIRVAARLGRDQAVVADVQAGAPLPRRDGFAGVIVTGSGAMVTDRLPWSERSAGWLRQATEAGLPVLGICYGHQLLAHALGGGVGDNPAGRELGTVQVQLTAAAAHDPLFGPLPRRFAAQSTHVQTVLHPPADAQVLAHSPQDRCQAFRVGTAAWGVQFHPEFSVARMRGYVAARAELLRTQGHCPVERSRTIGAAPVARTVLRRFVRLARAR